MSRSQSSVSLEALGARALLWPWFQLNDIVIQPLFRTCRADFLFSRAGMTREESEEQSKLANGSIT
jgi:hypothetical protein